MKRVLAAALLLCTVFLLCACPGGTPVPPDGGACPDCGKDPCECPDTPPSTDGTVSPDDADPSLVFGAGGAVAGAGDSIFDRSPVLRDREYDPSLATSLHIGRFFTQVRFDGGVYSSLGNAATPLTNASDTTYGGGTLTALLFPLGLHVSDCTNIVFRNLIIDGDVTLEKVDGVTFENVQINGTLTVASTAKNVTVNACRLSSLNNAGTDTFLVNSAIPYAGVGIQDSGRGLYVENCRIEGTGTGISSTGDGLQVRTSTVTATEAGVTLSGCENALVALCVVRGAQKSVAMTNVFNSVAVKNSLISVSTAGGTNVYVCDNAMGGRIFSEDNNYFIADGNTYPTDGLDHRAVVKDNRNVNGDALTDLNARAEVGANEALLPHVNKDLFVGMERMDSVKQFGKAEPASAYEYIATQASTKDCVILAPGVYTTEIALTLDSSHSNTTVYAYGAYVEAVEYPDKNYPRAHMSLTSVENLAFKGLTIGYAQQSVGQVYVLAKLGSNRVLAVTGAGMLNEFANSGSAFFSTTNISIQRAGTTASLGDFFTEKVQKNGDGTMVVTLTPETYEVVEVGDAMTCRRSSGSHTVQLKNCGGISFIDVTTYGSSGGWMFSDTYNTAATTFLRLCNTSRSGEVIDKATYDKYRALENQYGVDLEIFYDTLEDGTRRYRGSLHHVGSQDGIHGKCNVKGAQVTSSILENMCDDGSSQCGFYARLSEIQDNGDGTSTVIYKASLSEYMYYYYSENANIGGLCADFRAGDRLYVYTAKGQLVCDATVYADGVSYASIPSTCKKVKEQQIVRFAVTVDTATINPDALIGYDLTNDDPETTHKVLVENLSRATAGSTFDNCLVQNGHTNGVRLKAVDGTVKNCTIRNIAKTAISQVYDIWWGESGVAKGLTMQSCLIDHTGYAPDAPDIESTSANYKYCPITIMGLGGSSLEADHLLFSDIEILDNVFTRRVLDNYNYAIYARAASNITLRGNDFGYAEDEDGLEKFSSILYLNGSANIELSGNTYSPYISGTVELYVFGDLYKNIFGSDVEKNGASLIKDKIS